MSGSVSAQADFLTALAFTVMQEGGYSDDAGDPGGATNLGITLATLSEYWGRRATLTQIQALTVDTVAPIYHTRYWNALRCWGLPRGVALMVFDHAVNAGPGASASVLQSVVATGQSLINVAQDGIVGPMTCTGARAIPAPALIRDLQSAQEADYRGKDDFPTFGSAWLARLDRRAAEAQRIAKT